MSSFAVFALALTFSASFVHAKSDCPIVTAGGDVSGYQEVPGCDVEKAREAFRQRAQTQQQADLEIRSNIAMNARVFVVRVGSSGSNRSKIEELLTQPLPKEGVREIVASRSVALKSQIRFGTPQSGYLHIFYFRRAIVFVNPNGERTVLALGETYDGKAMTGLLARRKPSLMTEIESTSQFSLQEPMLAEILAPILR